MVSDALLGLLNVDNLTDKERREFLDQLPAWFHKECEAVADTITTIKQNPSAKEEADGR